MASQQLLLGSGAAKTSLGVNDVFRMDGYEGSGSSAQPLARGLDLATEGGMGFVSPMESTEDKYLFTTTLGANWTMELNSNSFGVGAYTNSFGTDGFELKGDNSVRSNYSGRQYVQRTWRNADKWFKEFKYIGNATSGRTITHNLGCVPGMIWIKSSSGTAVWHSSLGTFNSGGVAWSYYLTNSSDPANNADVVIRDVNATTFTIGDSGYTNNNGTAYYCMCFAGAQYEFGPNGDENIAKTGSYSGNAQADGPQVNIGFRPSMVMIKRMSGNGSWMLFDELMGVTEHSSSYHRDWKMPFKERNYGQSDPFINFNSYGFKLQDNNSDYNGSGTYIYYAVRAEDGACSTVPTYNQDLFDVVTANSSQDPNYRTHMKVDFGIVKENVKNGGTGNWQVLTRPMGGHRVRLASNHEGDDVGSTTNWRWAQKGPSNTISSNGQHGYNGLWDHDHDSNAVGSFWKSGPTFDYVQWYGNGASSRTIAHQLGKEPEFMMGRRWHTNGGNAGWNVYCKPAGNTKYFDGIESGSISTGASRWNNTTPDNDNFYIGSTADLNTNGRWHWMGLWASVDGLCKIGSYYGNGTDNRTISCGFQPRWLLLRRLDGGSDWCVFDVANASNWTQYLRWNNTGSRIAANQVTIVSDGFQVDNSSNSGNNWNGSGQHWFYMAQA